MSSSWRKWAALGALAVVVVAFAAITTLANATVVTARSTQPSTTKLARPTVLAGNFARQNSADDIVLVGGLLSTQPMAASTGDGAFTTTNAGDNWFAGLTRTPGIKVFTGEFNGDGLTDIALVGGVGWHTVPLALSNGADGFTILNPEVGAFGGWATVPGARAVAGDFNGDGNTDIALVGGAGWTTIPVASSNGSGGFTVTNAANPEFASWSPSPTVKVLTGDFDGDGRDDLALTGPAYWSTIPVAFSNGDGAFTNTNNPVQKFPNAASAELHPGVQVFTGRFNGDNKTDIVEVGATDAGQDIMMVAQPSTTGGRGVFDTVQNADRVLQFSGWASGPGVQIVPGDYNGDNYTDIALTGVSGWSTVPVAFSDHSGSFNVTNTQVPNFPGWATATQNGASVLAGHFDLDARTDLALVGGTGWSTIPVALSNGDGAFQVRNNDGGYVAQLAQPPVAPSLRSYPLTNRVVIFGEESPRVLVSVDVSMQAGESRRLLGQVSAVVSDPSFVELEEQAGIQCINGDQTLQVGPAYWADITLLRDDPVAVTSSLLLTAPTTGTYHCRLMAYNGSTNTAFTALPGSTWLQMSDADETGAQSWTNPPCDSPGTLPTCLYLGPGQARSSAFLLDDDGTPRRVWTAAANATAAAATANVELTTCGHTASCGGRRGDASGSTIDSHLEAVQLNSAGQPCRTTSTAELTNFIGNTPHHYNIQYQLANIPIESSCGTRDFILRVAVQWRSGNVVKIDGFRPEPQYPSGETTGFMVNAEYAR
jgi:hypothetical protein